MLLMRGSMLSLKEKTTQHCFFLISNCMQRNKNMTDMFNIIF